MDNLSLLEKEIIEELSNINNKSLLKSFFTKYLSKNGKFTALLKSLGTLPKEDRPSAGKRINKLKDKVMNSFEQLEADIDKKVLKQKYYSESIDISLPAIERLPGSLHPVTIVQNQLVEAFVGMGFKVIEGPEIEDEYHNFTALNTPDDHPARDKQDTFYISSNLLLRTHTSPVQIRSMEKLKPPFKIIAPGRVFRSDDDATHTPMFHQMEGLVIDKNMSLCDMHGLLDTLAKTVFTSETKTRFRPSYFPFTEPSVEVDVSCCECGGKGCRLCKGTGWLEILGGGVVNRKVITNCGLDPDVYSGIAFGTGLERIAMLKYGMNNIHILFDGDIRILNQFID